MATEAARLECKGIHRKEEGKRKQKEKNTLQERRRKTFLTLTGLLVEGVERTLRRTN
jgi:hypothetical protein